MRGEEIKDRRQRHPGVLGWNSWDRPYETMRVETSPGNLEGGGVDEIRLRREGGICMGERTALTYKAFFFFGDAFIWKKRGGWFKGRNEHVTWRYFVYISVR